MELGHKIAVMLHFLNGGAVEVRDTEGEWNKGEWFPTPKPSWNWERYEYRPAE